MNFNVTKNIEYIGVNDRTIDLFESQYIVPNGISYNSYIIKDEKIVIMDTVDKRATNEWLEKLINEDTEIFKECKPLTTQETLLEKYPTDKYDIKILSMTPKNASDEYCLNVIQQKNEWLDKYFPQLKKRIYKKYGYNKNLKNEFS